MVPTSHENIIYLVICMPQACADKFITQGCFRRKVLACSVDRAEYMIWVMHLALIKEPKILLWGELY